MEPAQINQITHPPHVEYFTAPPYCREVKKRYFSQNPESLKLRVSNPARLLLLFEKLTDASSKPLEVKINKYLMKEGESDSSFLIHLLPCSGEEAMVQVLGLEEMEKSLYFPVSASVVKTLVRYENNLLKCNDSVNPEIAEILSGVYRNTTAEFVLVPILGKKHKYFPCSTHSIKPVLVVCFINSKKDEDYLIKLSSEVFRFCQTVLLNTVAKEQEARKNKQYDLVLRSVRNILPQLEDVNLLFANIAFEVRKLTNARRSSMYLLDPEKVKFIKTFFDSSYKDKFRSFLRMVGDEKLAKHVVTSGKILNIKNAQEDPRVDQTIDEINGTRTRNILCFPIRDENSIIGAIQLCNKKGGEFTCLDEEIAKHFGVYSGMAIVHSTLYKDKKEREQRSKISNNVILHYKNVDDESVTAKMNCGLFHIHLQLDQFNFPPRTVPNREIVCFILRMFEDLGFVETFSMNKLHLTKFLMLVQQCHKEVAYHNWTHTFSVVHFAYLTLKKFNIIEKGYISSLEGLAYFLACLCYNLDHRGVNNPFQHKPFKALSTMYSSQGSVMQKYHFNQALAVLNTEGCNFLESLDSDTYNLCLNLFRDLIHAGDLASHFKLYSSQYRMTQEGYDKNNNEHRYYFTSLLVTCASFSDQVKDWQDIKQSMTETIEEFITLGSIQSEEGKQPVLLPVENLKLVPDLQIDFLKSVCLSAFKLMALVLPEAKGLVLKIKENILCWEAAKPLFIEAFVSEISCLDVLKSEELGKRVENVIDALLHPK